MSTVITPSRDEFIALAREYTVVPVWTQILADLETPVAAFIHAIIKIFPVSAHCAIAGTRPSELKVTAANCSGVATMTLPSALLGVWS